ncbi:DMT family transporter [Gluconobacter albidus]|uniref:Transporter n=1 Tax=Gluconobacter albidus TaxID=318683 RepID=A0AAW3QTH4_9PROT|nr:DMT family transporter [Gluconobacter albidus]KXV36945.1 transporter [Gluconobacter albidus]GBQ82613.1 drug/metabolite transporter superfamily permease [Gluconobacter albidus NBRC 3250]GLQ69786.1 transporter [Gluconobacter albidus]
MKRTTEGWGSGLLGVIIFSGSLPATRVAVADFLPIFLTSARAVIAALLGGLFLFTLRQPRPERQETVPLVFVAIGCVVGFPLLTALALQHITLAHSLVFIGILPLATAIFGVLRGGERPKPAFWLFSTIGAVAVAGFALYGSQAGNVAGDLLMVAAILVCGLGYAEGATLSRRLGGWQVISWSLLLSLPLMAIIVLAYLPLHWGNIHLSSWIGLGYVSVFSMLIGFIFWYRGLALGGIAGVGQLQLLQPFFGLLLATLLLHEPIAWTMIVSTLIVVLCVAGAKRFS